MNNIKAFFKADQKYVEDIKKYDKVDGLLAILLFVVIMVCYYFMGRIYLTKQLYLGIPFNLLLGALCFIPVVVRKQKLTSLGFTTYKLKKAVILGSVLGVLVLILNNISILSMPEVRLRPVKSLVYDFFYYLIVIAFVEELIFRGYIQTRLYGLIKNDLATTTISAIMFSLCHIPFQMANRNMDLINFLANQYVWLILLVIWHFVFTFLYKKYNSLVAGTIFHWLMDFSNNLFL